MNTEQQENLERVSVRIGAAIVEFCAHRFKFYSDDPFHADDLRKYVAQKCGASAPASADRILRDLRKRKVLNYKVVSRRESTYVMLPVEREPTKPEQLRLL